MAVGISNEDFPEDCNMFRAHCRERVRQIIRCTLQDGIVFHTDSGPKEQRITTKQDNDRNVNLGRNRMSWIQEACL